MTGFIFEQFKFLCIFIVNGFAIGLLFDLFRSIRKVFQVSDIRTYIQDFIFTVLFGLSLIISIFKFNNGEIRGYLFLCILLGIMLYYYIFSNLIMKIYTYLFKKLARFVNFAIKIIDKYLKIVYNLLQCIAEASKKAFKTFYSIKKDTKKKDFSLFCRKK